MSRHKANKQQVHHTDTKDDEQVHTQRKGNIEQQHRQVDLQRQQQQQKQQPQQQKAQTKDVKVEHKKGKPVMECPFPNGVACTLFPIRRGYTRALITRDPMYRSACPPSALEAIIEDHDDKHDELPFVSFLRGGWISREPNGKFVWKHPEINDVNAKWFLTNIIVPFYDCRKDKEEFADLISRGHSRLRNAQLGRVDRMYNRYKKWLCEKGCHLYDNLYRNIDQVKDKDDIRTLCWNDYRLVQLHCDSTSLCDQLRSCKTSLHRTKTRESNWVWPENVTQFIQTMNQRATTQGNKTQQQQGQTQQRRKVDYSYTDVLPPAVRINQRIHDACVNARRRTASAPQQQPTHANELAKQLYTQAYSNNPLDIRLNSTQFANDIQSGHSRLHRVFAGGPDTARSHSIHRAKLRQRRQCCGEIIRKHNPADIRLSRRRFLRDINNTKRTLHGIPSFTHDVMLYRLNNAQYDRACQEYLAHRIARNSLPWKFTRRVKYNKNHATSGSTHGGVKRVEIVRQDRQGRNVSWIQVDDLMRAKRGLTKVGITNIPFETRTMYDILRLLGETKWCYHGDPKFIATEATQRRRRGSFFSQLIGNIKRAVGIDSSDVGFQRRDHQRDLELYTTCAQNKDTVGHNDHPRVRSLQTDASANRSEQPHHEVDLKKTTPHRTHQ